jgi:hypothetical protein
MTQPIVLRPYRAPDEPPVPSDILPPPRAPRTRVSSPAHPWIVAASPQPVRAGDPAGGAGPTLVFNPARDAYVLSDSARRSLQPLFDSFGFDVSCVTVRFAPSWRVGWKNDAYTLGDSITVNRNTWEGKGSVWRLGLLAHEVTHSVQYARLGYAGFLTRYGPEWFRDRNYHVPPTLEAILLRLLDPVDRRFTLDQIANRVALAAMRP